jgi:serine/threonine protein kinase
MAPSSSERPGENVSRQDHAGPSLPPTATYHPSPPDPGQVDPKHAEVLGDRLDQYITALQTPNQPPSTVSSDHPELEPLQQMADRVHGLDQFLSAPAVPKEIGKFVVKDLLGSGGQAITYLAWDLDLKRHVVIKLYHVARTEQEQETILKEGQALARIQSPYVAQCYGVERHQGMPYLVMEYLRGENLATFHRARPMTVPEALEVATQLAEGLGTVHARGLLHRDLKPGNILIGDDGRPRLVDFGFARPLGDDALRHASGTLAYMPPEQARGEEDRIDPRTDLFGLGAVLYYLLTGGPPYRATSREELWEAARAGQVTPARERNSKLSAAVNALCMRCLQKDPAQRFASAGELAQAIRRWQGRRRSLPWLAVAFGVLMVLLAGALWWRAAGPTEEGEKPKGPAPSQLIKSLRVFHIAQDGNQAVERGIMGNQSTGAAFGDSVLIRVTLSEPAYAYLLAFNCDGEEQLLLPAGKDRRPDPSVPPPRRDRLEYPARKDKWFCLDDNPSGGLQAFAVVVSRRPLPPYAGWHRARGNAAWRKLPPGEGVWIGDVEGVYPVLPGKGGVRGHERDLPGAPPLRELCRSLARAGGEVVEVLAFPVNPKEKHR